MDWFFEIDIHNLNKFQYASVRKYCNGPYSVLSNGSGSYTIENDLYMYKSTDIMCPSTCIKEKDVKPKSFFFLNLKIK